MRNGSDQTSRAAFQRACQRIVQTLVEKYDWSLLEAHELAELVLNSASTAASSTDLERLTRHHYSTVLYQACRQTEDPRRRERGYTELSRLLYRVAYNRWPDLAEDVMQGALTLVYEQIDRCRNPGTFLAFALYKLRHAAQQEQRARGRDLYREERDLASAKRNPTVLPPELLDERERLQVLLDAVARLPDERAGQAILLKFFGGINDEVIAARLGITPGHVRVLRHRGLQRLRVDERLGAYFEEQTTRQFDGQG